MAEGTNNLGKVKLDQPYSIFRFLVKMGNQTTASCAFTSFSGIKMNTQMAKLRSGEDPRGVKDNYPGITEFQNITLKKGVIESNSFLEWIFSATFPDNIVGPKGNVMYRDLTIVALTQDGREGVQWELLNAIPVSYELQPMDAAQSGILCETLEFAIAGVQRKAAAGVSNQVDSYAALEDMPDQYRGRSVSELMDIQKTSNKYTAQAKKYEKEMREREKRKETRISQDEFEQEEKKRLKEERAKQKEENEKKLEEEREEKLRKIQELMDEQKTLEKYDEEREAEKLSRTEETPENPPSTQEETEKTPEEETKDTTKKETTDENPGEL